MKKLLIILLLACGASGAFAQKGVGKVFKRALRVDEALIAQRAMQQQMRFITRQTLLSMELAELQRIPLKINGVTGSWTTSLALPFKSAPAKKTILGRLAPKGYDDKYPVADMELDMYLMRLSKSEETAFLYRGMHLANLDEIKHILLDGLEVSKTGYDRIYLSTVPSVGKLYAETAVPAEMLKEIPVLALVEQDIVADYLKEERTFHYYYYSEADIPAEAISHVFAFLEINSRPAWYRVVLENEMIFIPLPKTPYFP